MDNLLRGWRRNCFLFPGSNSAKRSGKVTQWAVRNDEGRLFGGIGFTEFEPGLSHKAEIGYWLAKPYWGKGIMPAVITKTVEIGFRDFELIRISAIVMSDNSRSVKVLEKCGFSLEGTLRNFYLKNEQVMDGKLFAITNANGVVES